MAIANCDSDSTRHGEGSEDVVLTLEKYCRIGTLGKDYAAIVKHYDLKLCSVFSTEGSFGVGVAISRLMCH